MSKLALNITFKSGILLTILLVFSVHVFSQTDRKMIRKGNSEYEKGKYKEAEIDYRKALEKNPQAAKAQYNLGAATYKQKNAEEATKMLQQVNPNQLSRRDRAKLYHNLGNSFLESKKYNESIQAYKQALKFNPNDADTRYNLAYAMKKLQAQQQQQQQQQGGGENKDQKKQDQQQKQDQQKQQQQKQQISKEDAERMMEAMKNNEKNTMDKLNKKKAKVTNVKIEKDW